MKITLEPTNIDETELIIRGDLSSKEVEDLLNFLRNKTTSKKLFLYKDNEHYLVDVSDVVYLEASNNKISVFTQNDAYETKQKLYELKELLSTFTFAQINKSTLVNIDYVKSVQAEFSGNYTLRLKNKKEILTISRKYFKEFKSKI